MSIFSIHFFCGFFSLSVLGSEVSFFTFKKNHPASWLCTFGSLSTHSMMKVFFVQCWSQDPPEVLTIFILVAPPDFLGGKGNGVQCKSVVCYILGGCKVELHTFIFWISKTRFEENRCISFFFVPRDLSWVACCSVQLLLSLLMTTIFRCGPEKCEFRSTSFCFMLNSTCIGTETEMEVLKLKRLFSRNVFFQKGLKKCT